MTPVASLPAAGREADKKISRALAAFDWLGAHGHAGRAFVTQEDYDALLAGIDELRRELRTFHEALARISEHRCHGCDAGDFARAALKAVAP